MESESSKFNGFELLRNEYIANKEEIKTIIDGLERLCRHEKTDKEIENDENYQKLEDKSYDEYFFEW